MRIALTFLMLLAMMGLFNLHAKEVESFPHVLKIHLPGKASFEYAGFIAAQEKGFFKEHGFEVELIFAGTPNEAQNKVLEGEVHFSVCGSEILLNHQKGLPLIALAAYLQRSPWALVMSHEDGGTTWLKKKAGKKLALIKEKPIEILSILKKTGLSLNDFEVEFRAESRLERFDKGEIDGFEINLLEEKLLLKNLNRKYHNYVPAFFGAEFYDQVLYSNKNFYSSFEEHVGSFTESISKGWEFALKNRNEIIDILQIKYEVSLSKKALMNQHWLLENRLIVPNLIKIGNMKPLRWELIKDLYSQHGLLPKKYDSTEFYHQKKPSKVAIISTYSNEILTAIGIVIFVLIVMIFFNRKLSNMVTLRTNELAEVNWQLSKFNEELENKIHTRTQELENALKEAEVASKAKSTFLANMTHEIRTPMNSILGFAQIMKEKSSDSDVKKYMDTINSSGQSLLRMINDVLDISRVESGKFTLDYSRFNLIRLIEESMNLFKNDVLSKNITLKFDHDDECPEYVYLDKDRLRQALTNIIGNAIKFTEDGLVEVKLSVKMVGPKDADIQIAVKDTGIGIPEEDLESIFEEFEQVENIHLHYGGTGLGLAISRRIVAMMNGSLKVESELGRGADFVIELANVGIVDQADKDEKGTRLKYFFDPAKVIIVDECQLTRDLFEAYLSVTRLTVRCYKSSFDALEEIDEFKPNLIITEINLRSMDGFQFAEEVLKKDEFRKTPIIAISPVTYAGCRKKFRIFNGFLKKPISVNDFYESISHFLPSRKVDKSIEIKEIHIDSCELPKHGSEFRVHITKEIRDKCSEIMKFQVINDYNNLAITLRKLAQQKELKDLKLWLDEFQTNLDVFNFDALNRQLEYLMNNKSDCA